MKKIYLRDVRSRLRAFYERSNPPTRSSASPLHGRDFVVHRVVALRRRRGFLRFLLPRFLRPRFLRGRRRRRRGRRGSKGSKARGKQRKRKRKRKKKSKKKKKQKKKRGKRRKKDHERTYGERATPGTHSIGESRTARTPRG